jgi:hypothetical protein
VNRTAPLALAAALAVGALITAGCGSSSSSSSSTASNGEASKSATQIVADAKAAAASASSVHVVITGLPGTVSSATLDMSRGNGAKGTLVYNNQNVDLVVVGSDTYFKGTAGFWTQATGSASSAKLFANKWLKVPASTSSSSLSSVKSLTDMSTFFDQTLTPTGTVTKVGPTTFNGSSVVELKSSKGGSLFVSLTGTPYPMGIQQSSAKGAGVGKFTAWNVPISVSVPSGAIDLPTG